MALDASGRIHIAGNQHNDPMRYLRSTNPGDITSWTAADAPGQGFTSITYPQFVRLWTGELFISYRSGVSGNGDNWLEKWQDDTGTWASERNPAIKVFDGVASGENPYLHQIAVGPDDSIHQAIVWRVTGNAMTNNNLWPRRFSRQRADLADAGRYSACRSINARISTCGS